MHIRERVKARPWANEMSDVDAGRRTYKLRVLLQSFRKRARACKGMVDRLALLQEFAAVRLGDDAYANIPARRMRSHYERMLAKRHYRDVIKEPCFVCRGRAEARHHVVQIQHGGRNTRVNLVGICSGCHAEVHPWLKGQ